MAVTYTKIADYEVGSGGAASIDFTSIPSSFTDIVVKLSARTNRSDSGDDIAVKFNTSASNFTGRRIFGTGSNAVSTTCDNQVGILNGGTSTSNTFGSLELYIPNYAGSTNKSYSADATGENNATTAYAQLTAGLWSVTSAITGISFYSQNSANFVQYSTATLYGVNKS
jgi:hypothetical protein